MQVVRLDNLYAPLPRGSGLFDDYDWPLLIHILETVRHGKPLQYQSRGFEGDCININESLPRVVIVEGVQLFREEFMKYFDISVWIDCPLPIAIQRAKARDLKQGHDEQYMKRWDTEWEPRNLEYFTNYHPEQLASFVYKETS